MVGWLNIAALAGGTIASGTFAARAAAGSVGRFYIATDINRIYADNGTRWVAPDETAGLNVLDYGAKADGVTDDTAAIQGAINALSVTGAICLPIGNCRTTAPLTLPIDGIVFKGVAMEDSSTSHGSWITNASSDVFAVASDRLNITFRDLGIRSGVGGGHIFNMSAAWANWTFDHVALVQANAAKAVINATVAPIGGAITGRSYLSGAAGRSFPIIRMTVAGSVTNWGIENSTILCSATDTQYAIAIDNTTAAGGAVASHNFFRNLVVETCNGGFLDIRGIEYTEVSDIWMGDFSGATTADLIYCGVGSGGHHSSHNTFRRIKAYGRTLGAGLYDLNLVDGTMTVDDVFGAVKFGDNGNTVINCDVTGGGTTITSAAGTLVLHRPSGARTGPFMEWYLATGASTKHFCGAGTPEGVVTAVVGDVYHNQTGGAGTCLYIKEAGSGNTGWVAK